MHQFSDSDTPDSDEGIRFKTDSTRNKEGNKKVVRSPRSRRRLSKSRSKSLERRRNSRRGNRDSDRNNRERSRERYSYRRRSLSKDRRESPREKRSPPHKDRKSPIKKRSFSNESKLILSKERRSFSKEKTVVSSQERRSVSKERNKFSKERSFSTERRSFSRERRSFSKDRRTRHKSRDRSTEQSSKHDRSHSKMDKNPRCKRSASPNLKTDLNKRQKDSKSESSTKARHEEKSTTDTTINSLSNNEEKEKRTTVKEPLLKAPPELLGKDMNVEQADIHDDNEGEAFGPALPPRLLINSEQDMSSLSPKRRSCKHKKASHKKHHKDNERIEVAIAAVEEDMELDNTSPISSGNSVPDDAVPGDGVTFPPVPPSFQQNVQNKFVIEIVDSDTDTENITSGPKINENLTNSSGIDCYRPETPSKHLANDQPPVQYVGPFIPDHLRQKLLDNADKNGCSTTAAANISIMSDDEIEEGEIVGPTLPGSIGSLSAGQIALEERALQYKLARLSSGNSAATDVKVREDWMLLLPERQTAAKMGLEPRQFRTRVGPDMSDRSGWTETPKDRDAKLRLGKSTKEDNKVDFKAEAERLETEERDNEQERMARRHHKKHRKKEKKDKSLMEMHQDKLKAKKNSDEDGQNIRRPFNRDTDLKVNQFDDAQKKAIYKKAQLLDDRFSKGDSKYL